MPKTTLFPTPQLTPAPYSNRPAVSSIFPAFPEVSPFARFLEDYKYACQHPQPLKGKSYFVGNVRIVDYLGVRMFCAPRRELKQLLARRELGFLAIYALLYRDYPMPAYFGQSVDFRKRVHDHDSKDWDRVAVFVHMHNMWSSLNIKEIERLLLADMGLWGAKLTNLIRGIKQSGLTEKDTAEAQDYLKVIVDLSRHLDEQIFHNDVEPNLNPMNGDFFIYQRLICCLDSTDRQQRRIIVLPSSVACGGSFPNFVRERLPFCDNDRDYLVTKGYLKKDRSNDFVVVKPIPFLSPTYAIKLLSTQSRSGLQEFKTADGRSLGQIRKERPHQSYNAAA